MKLAVFLILALVLVNVEAALLHLFGAGLVRVDVALVIVAFLAQRSMPLEGAIGSFFAGYFVDVISGQPTGLYAFLGVLVFLLAKVACAALDARGVGGFALVAAATSLAHGVLAWLLTIVSASPDVVRSSAQLTAALPTALWTAIAAVPLFYLLRWIEHRFTREEPGLLV